MPSDKSCKEPGEQSRNFRLRANRKQAYLIDAFGFAKASGRALGARSHSGPRHVRHCQVAFDGVAAGAALAGGAAAAVLSVEAGFASFAAAPSAAPEPSEAFAAPFPA